MHPVADPLRQNPNPAAMAEVLAYVQALEQQLAVSVQQLEQRNQEITRREQEIHALEIKNQKLAFELAYLRRIRFGVDALAVPSGTHRGTA